MIDPQEFYLEMTDNGLRYFAGVPDSLLKNLCAYITDHTADEDHVIAANEGGAVALALGYHLSTGGTPVVYMQNSGLGNIINPLLSLADPQVYGIPLVLVIGWRGEILADGAQVKDEPQHKKQGQVTEALLQAMSIPYEVIDAKTSDYGKSIARLTVQSQDQSQPVALLIRKGTFSPYVRQEKEKLPDLMTREQAIHIVLSHMAENSFIVSTTGMASRELYEARKSTGQGHQKDFLVVGGMGHASQIACEMSKRSRKKIYCLDGDGAFIMHMGSTALNAGGIFCHIVLNNRVHDSVGGQPSAAQAIDICAIARACGYHRAICVDNEAALIKVMDGLRDFQDKGTCLIEINISPGARKDLGRPGHSSLALKAQNMKYLGSI